jgi:hypothetical protein
MADSYQLTAFSHAGLGDVFPGSNRIDWYFPRNPRSVTDRRRPFSPTLFLESVVFVQRYELPKSPISATFDQVTTRGDHGDESARTWQLGQLDGGVGEVETRRILGVAGA